MLSKLTIQNFKSIKTATLDMAPLTVLVGANSSGKTALIQSILLIRQTLESKLTDRPLMLNGPIIRLGTIEDVRHEPTREEPLSIGFSLNLDSAEDHTRRRTTRPRSPGGPVPIEVSLAMDFLPSKKEVSEELGQLQPTLQHLNLKANRERPDATGYSEYAELNIVRSAQDPEDRAEDLGITSSSAEAHDSLEYEIEDWSGERLLKPFESHPSTFAGCQFRHFLPDTLYAVMDNASRRARIAVQILTESEWRAHPRYRRQMGTEGLYLPEQSIEWLRSLLSDSHEDLLASSTPRQQSLFPNQEPQRLYLEDWIERVGRMSPASRKRLIDQLSPYSDELEDELREAYSPEIALEPQMLPFMDSVGQSVTNFFTTRVRYLGPLRDRPKPLYPLEASSDPTDVGLAGENTAAVLDLYSEHTISHVPPHFFENDDVQAQVRSTSLQHAVTAWMQYLQVADAVRTSDRGKLGHELRVAVNPGEEAHDLTHVGVGVSQCLPLVVMCLNAPRGSTLILEQPELHLHPSVQGRLADFFLSLMLMGKQCIVETHSEYLINRLRYRIASTTKRELSEDICTYYVEKHEGDSSFRSVHINEYGNIEDWPRGFFDESQLETERLVRAASRRLRLERGQ